MKHYDPNTAPDPSAWLALEPQARIRLIEAHHRRLRTPPQQLKAHNVIHTLVENQAAECLPAVMQALYRLQEKGLSRHEAVHAVGAVAARHLSELMRQDGEDTGFAERYAQALDALA